MAGRRGAWSGRGWDALPPRPPRHPPDEHPPGGAVDGEAERGNVPARRRRLSPGGYPTPPGEFVGRGDSGQRGGVPEQDESERAREICLRQLAVRPRTRAELAKALARKEISDEVI